MKADGPAGIGEQAGVAARPIATEVLRVAGEAAGCVGRERDRADQRKQPVRGIDIDIAAERVAGAIAVEIGEIKRAAGRVGAGSQSAIDLERGETVDRNDPAKSIAATGRTRTADGIGRHGQIVVEQDAATILRVNVDIAALRAAATPPLEVPPTALEVTVVALLTVRLLPTPSA